ncbi:MAG: adenylate/guanylate cyclase domain-containing protein [Flavobacteriales bacterium]
MNRSIRAYLNLLWQSFIFWFFTFFLFLIIRYSGMKTNLEIEDPNFTFTLSDKFLYALIMGAIVGFIFSIVEYLFQKYISKKIVIALQFVLKTIIYLITLIALFTFIRWLFQYEQDIEIQEEEKDWWKTNASFWVGVIVFIIATLNFSFIKIALEKFGKKNFVNLLIGKYNTPREEERIFMFLDLKDSTTIAESLGHIKYSQFIQECFFDLNNLVLLYHAEIYQYVGDEVVLTWDSNIGFKNNNCIELFKAFYIALEKKTDYYENTFGVAPKFKAGIHGGKLIVAEVGSVKKEIAYHGDVINTAARIQSMCNTYEQNLMLSEDIKLNIDTSSYTLEELGDLLLKGKLEKVKVFGLK